MSEPEIELIKPEGLTVYLPSIGAPMAVRAEGDEVVILMRLTLRPRDNVVKLDLDVSASGDSAAVPGFDQDAPFDISRYWRAPIPGFRGDHEGKPSGEQRPSSANDDRQHDGGCLSA